MGVKNCARPRVDRQSLSELRRGPQDSAEWTESRRMNTPLKAIGNRMRLFKSIYAAQPHDGAVARLS